MYLFELSTAYFLVTLVEWNCAIQAKFDFTQRTSDEVYALVYVKNKLAIWGKAVPRILRLALVDAKRFGVVQQLLLFGHHPIEIRTRERSFA